MMAIEGVFQGDRGYVWPIAAAPQVEENALAAFLEHHPDVHTVRCNPRDWNMYYRQFHARLGASIYSFEDRAVLRVPLGGYFVEFRADRFQPAGKARLE